MAEPYQLRTRTGPFHPTRQAAQFYKRGLMQVGESARALGVNRIDLKQWGIAGLIAMESFEYKGQTLYGFPVTEILKLRRKMGLTP